MNLKHIGLLITCFIWLIGIQAQSFKVGAALRVITPDPLLPVSGGVGQPKPANIQHGDLFVRAVVFEKGTERVAIAIVDNLGWPAVLGDRSRALVKGIPPKNILIGATHTHSAPDAYGFPDESGQSPVDLDYLDDCVTQIADAINEAVANLQPASLKIAVGEAQGKIAYNYYAPQLYDPRCGVIQAVATSGADKGKNILTLVNYAIHPEVIGANRQILSPDVCGPLYDRIEEQGGGMALFVNGAQGGMITADNRREGGKEAADWAECQRIGTLLADEALRIVKDAPHQENPGLYCTSQRVQFPIESEMMQFIFEHSPLNYEGVGEEVVDTQVNLLNIGTAQLLTIPGEALPNIGYYLKRKMKGDHAFLLGLVNDAFGYILTEEDFNSFKRYEYVSRTSLGEMTGEIFMEEALNLVNQHPSPTQTQQVQSVEAPKTWAEKLGFPAGKKVIILHADDIGMCEEANISAKNYLKKAEIQSAAVMMPCPNADDFISWAREHPQVDVGLHLTLTSEWKTYRWGSVKDAKYVPGLIDPEGKLWRSVIQVVQNASATEVEAEIRAQVEKSLALGYRPDHIDTHMGTLYGSHEFTAAYLKVAEEYQIPAMVIDMSNPVVVQGFKDQGYPIGSEMIELVNNYSLPKLDFFASAPNGENYEDKKAKFFALVQSIPNGLTEIIFHPSEPTENLKTITNSWKQRGWEAQLFSDPEVKAFFEEEGIIFTNWKELMKRFRAMR